MLSRKCLLQRIVSKIVDEGGDPGGLAYTRFPQDQNVEVLEGLEGLQKTEEKYAIVSFPSGAVFGIFALELPLVMST